MDGSELTSQILALVDAGAGGLDEGQRLRLLAACNKLRDTLQSPIERTIQTMLGGHDPIALRLAIDLGLPDIALANNGPITIEELAGKSKADIALVRRIMRFVSCLGVFSEVDVDTYTATPLTGTYSTSSPMREVVIHLSTAEPTIGRLPDYFAERGWQNPDDALNGPWQFAEHTTDQYWEWLAKRERLQRAFNIVMGMQRKMRGEDWFEFFPVEEKLSVGDVNEGGVVFVDIGGGLGHDLVRFKTRFPELRGKFVLEDLPSVVAAAKDLPADIATLGHDFFIPHPDEIKGAKAYYLRTILHDWPDKQALAILANIKDIMAPNSLLLINEGVLAEKGVSLFEARHDFHMMARFSALERTEKQWRVLLEEAGFELVQIWRSEQVAEAKGALMEVVVRK